MSKCARTQAVCTIVSMTNTPRLRAVHAKAAILLLLLASSALSQSLSHIPAAHGVTLTGMSVTLPQSLQGEPAVLILGFSHASQAQVANWGNHLAQVNGDSKEVTFYEIPMLGGAPKMLRGMIIKSMGKSVPEAQKPHFLPLTEDDKPWRTAANYDKPDIAYILLVDGKGAIRWRTEGDESDTTYSELMRHLAEVSRQGVR